VLERDLEIALGDWPGAEFYRITTALVIPRQVGWIKWPSDWILESRAGA
jgi:hypothetical protein